MSIKTKTLSRVGVGLLLTAVMIIVGVQRVYADQAVTAGIQAGGSGNAENNGCGVPYGGQSPSSTMATASGSNTVMAPAVTTNDGTFTYFNGNTQCLRVYLSDSYFTTDFRIGARMFADPSSDSCNPNGCWGAWDWTNWASDIANNGASPYSPTVAPTDANGRQVQHDRWNDIQIEIETRPMPNQGQIIHANLGVALLEDDYGYPINGGAFPVASGDFFYTPEGGGWSNLNCAGNRGGCSNTPDVFGLYLSAQTLDLSYQSTNIPTAYSTLQTVTAGTDGNPLEITVKNTSTAGSPAWLAAPQYPGTNPTGDCTWDSNGDGVLDSPNINDTGQSCTVTYNYSYPLQLQHVSGSFGVNPTETASIGLVNVTRIAEKELEHICTPGGPANSGDYSNQLAAAYLAFLPPPINCYWISVSTINTTYSAPTTFGPGQTASFVLSTLTAPAKAGTYTETWQAVTSEGSSIGSAMPLTLTVSGSSGTGPVGTINVSSENSATQAQISSSWDIMGPSGDVCGKSSCFGKFGTYTNQPANPDTYTLIPGSSSGYAVNSVSPCNTGSCAQTLASDGSTISFTVLWDPLAIFAVANSIPTLSPSNPQGTFTVQNNGTSGSQLEWTASVGNYSSGGSGWLSLSSTGGTENQGASPDTIKATANVSGLGAGTYTAQISFGGDSLPGTPPHAVTLPKPITVTLCIGSGCGGGVTITVSVAPSSQLIPVKTSYNFTPTTNDASGVTWSLSGSGCSGSTCGSLSANATLSGVAVTYTAPNAIPNPSTVTLTAKSVTDPTKSASATITVGAPLPYCNLSANPPTVIVPSSSNLTYACTNVSSCTDIMGTGADGSQSDAGPVIVSGSSANGFVNVAPTQNTTYVFTCQGLASGPGYTTSATVPVNVTNPGIGECGPGSGPGCIP